jgi:beta-N-acetylhexosaminidase
VTDTALGRLADAILIPPFPSRSAPRWLLAALADGLAGVTLFGPNIGDPAQLAELTQRLRAATGEPVIAIDEEGGDVTRIAHHIGSPYPGNAALGAVDDTDLTRDVYAALGAELAILGINLNLAPSVDVNTAADNPVIGIRSFGSDTALVARHAAAAVSGLQSAGVAACAKHFPGHGSTSLDSHHVLATVDGSLDELMSRDLPPFEAAIAAGVRAVMPSHLLVPELTGDLPASLSPRAVTGLLRGDLGFTGVVVSDGLEMRAVSEPYGIPEAAVLAVLAGTDLLCLGRDQDELDYLAVRTALVEAVISGRMPGARLEQAAARVAELRAWMAAGRAIPDGSPQGWPGQAGPGQPASQAGQIGLAAARRAVQASGVATPVVRPLLVELITPANMAVGRVPWGLSAWIPADSVRRLSIAAPAPDLATATAEVIAESAGRSLLIVVRDAHRYPAAAEALQRMLAVRPDAIVVEMGLPVWRPAPAVRYLATYGAATSNGRAAAEVLGLASTQPTANTAG